MIGISRRAFLTGASVASLVTSYLRGVNLSGSESGGSIYAIPPLAAVDYLAAKGATVFRIPFSMERMCPTPGGEIAEPYASRIGALVTHILSLNLRPILDPHNSMRFSVGATFDDYNGPSGGTVNIIGQDAGYTAAQFNDFHTKLFQRFPDQRIIHGLNNEPHDVDDATLKNTQQGAINALRDAGFTGLILVAGNNYNTYAWDVGAPNRTYMPQITDPLNNWAVDQHHYNDAYGPGQSTTVVSTYMDKLTQFTAFARSVGLKAFLGEFGAGSDATSLAAMSSVLRHVASNADVYIGFTYWTAVQYQDGYIYQSLPTELTSIAPTDPLPAVVTDRAQMSVLGPYFRQAPAAPSVVVAPVITGVPNVGSVFASTGGALLGFPVPTIANQWNRNGSPIPGATGLTYTVVPDDVGASITCTATATNGSGTIASTSNALGPVTQITTWDPSHMGSNVTLSNGNLVASGQDPFPVVRATSGASTGKKYSEVTFLHGGGSANVGLIDGLLPLDGTQPNNVHGIALGGDGGCYGNTSQKVGGAPAVADGETVAMAVDLDAKLAWFFWQGKWNNNASANPATGVGGLDISYMSGLLYPECSPYYNTLTGNFGATAYAFTPPSGFGNW